MTLSWQAAVDFTFMDRPSWKGKEKTQFGIACRHFGEFYGEDEPCESITRKVIKAYTSWMEDEGRADATINRHLSAVHVVLDHCVEEDELDMNIPKFTRKPKTESRPWWFSKEQVDQLCEKEIKTGLTDLIRFASLTGARMSELLKIQQRDIDLDAGLIYIGGRPEFNTKTGNWRTVPIHDNLVQMLRDRTEGIPHDVFIFGDQWMNGKQVLYWFKKRCKQLGYKPHMVFHCLRHSFATWAIEDGVPIRVLMELMGHSEIETTLRYAKVTDSSRRQAILSILV